jgi:hypothetical protein
MPGEIAKTSFSPSRDLIVGNGGNGDCLWTGVAGTLGVKDAFTGEYGRGYCLNGLGLGMY